MIFEESSAEAWVSRFGIDAPPEADALANFLRHRSVRRYSDKVVDEILVRSLIGVAQSASTSSNLQLWSVVTVQDPQRREDIVRLCGDQKQVQTAPWFLAFFADHHRLRRAAKSFGEDCKGLDYNEFFTMAVIDASLAAERLVCAAESLGLGVCYIGALRNDPEGVKDFFELPEGVFGIFGLCLGWPSDGNTSAIKPRLATESIMFQERYNQQVDTSEFDKRMAEFSESQGLDTEVTWTQKSGRRVDEHHLTGRERSKAFLENQGFDRR